MTGQVSSASAAAGPALARLQVLVAAVLFSTGGAAVKATDLDGWQVAGCRAGIAALFLLAASRHARSGWNLRIAPVAVVFGSSLLLFVLANKLTTAANTIFLVSTAPIYLLLLSPWLLKERPERRELLMLMLVGAGMAFFFWGSEAPQATAPAPELGNALAVASGFTWALTVAGLRWLGRGGSGSEWRFVGGSMPAVVLGNACVFLVCLPRLVTISGGSGWDFAVVGYLGVVQIGVAYMFLTAAVRRVSAFETSLLLMAEPALSPLWAFLAHGEWVSAPAVAGGALILAGVALPSLYLARRGTGGRKRA